MPDWKLGDVQSEWLTGRLLIGRGCADSHPRIIALQA